MSPRDNSLKVTGIDNLFCAGEKIGPCVGHTEAILSGCLAGYNAVKFANGESFLQLPVELACGDYINYTGKAAKTPEGLSHKYTFSGSTYFERMKELGLYITEQAEIKNNVMRVGLTGIFAEKSKPAR
jgi:folate-dependent tRNA-U54 methylase TrmFO/GidA